MWAGTRGDIVVHRVDAMARGMKKFIGAACAAAALMLPQADSLAAGATAPAPLDVDLALVLQVDVSGSIDYEEAMLQRKGIADALASKQVVQAIQAGSLRRIGIAVVFFASREFGVMDVPIGWTVVSDEKSATALAQQILTLPRQSGRGTSIAEGLLLSAQMLDTMPLRAPRMVIDVSGDGPNNIGDPMLEARNRVLARGMVINGLPIVDGSAAVDLERYFQGCVIGGPGSFVIPASDFVDFARAIRRKLVLEISGLTPAERPSGQPALLKAAATPDAARPRQGFAPPRTPPYEGGCDFPMFGGGGFGFR